MNKSIHFAGLLDVLNIVSADTGISWQTEGHSLGDHLSNELVSITPSSVIESIVLCSVFMIRVSQCPISLRAEHPISAAVSKRH
jgi:hypothetical protein